LTFDNHNSVNGIREFARSSVAFVQSAPESLNQMQFCTAQSTAGSLLGGGTACDNSFFGLADGKHATWAAGSLW